MRDLTTIQVYGLKYKPRKGIFENYKGSCTFDPRTIDAYSYSWWRFVEKIGPYIVYNNYRYSNQTTKHQYKIKDLLERLGLKVHFSIDARLGLQRLDIAITDYQDRIEQLKKLIATPKTRKVKNAERALEIKRLEKQIQVAIKLQKLQLGAERKVS